MIAHEARRMLRAHRYGALGTLSKKFDGYPFGSITPYLVDHDGSLLILISTLAEHTKNIRHDPRVSLITHDQRDPHIQTQGRVTVVGNARLEPNREQAGLRYLRYFPEAQTYFAMHDFSFYRIRPVAIRYIGGFGKIHWVNMENYPGGNVVCLATGGVACPAEITPPPRCVAENFWGAATRGLLSRMRKLSDWIAMGWMCAATNKYGGWIFLNRSPVHHWKRWPH